MSRWKGLGVRWLLAGCLMAAGVGAAWGQVDEGHPAVDPRRVDGTAVGGPVDLSASWLAKQGDDAGYAAPGLDDRSWVVVQPARRLADYGFKDVDVLWYRTHVTMPAGVGDLALRVRRFGGSYKVYANGEQIGAYGEDRPGGAARESNDRQYAVPARLLQAGALTIAVRGEIGLVSEFGRAPGGMSRDSGVYLETAQVAADASKLYFFQQNASSGINLELAFILLFVAVALALTLRSEREYLALSLAAAGAIVAELVTRVQVVTAPTYAVWQDMVWGVAIIVHMIALLEFVRIVLGLRRSRSFIVYEWMLGFVLLCLFGAVAAVYSVGGPEWAVRHLFVAESLYFLMLVPMRAGLPVIAIWVWWKRRSTDTLLLILPLCFQASTFYYAVGHFFLVQMHLARGGLLTALPIRLFSVSLGDVTGALFESSLLIFLIFRTLRIARSRAAMITEMQAAHTVQSLLLAKSSQPTPGFTVESVYLPAGEVGGDFFLVTPGPDGSLTAIVGDVSGKGLVAAMRVAMILGVLRREPSTEPAMILQGLNDALLTQGDVGFTTACCVRLERGGEFTVANAGHIAPYVDGVEIETAGSLPLGIADGQAYEQTRSVLPSGKRMVLMSDGVVEARSAKGELYGFERLGNLTRMSAEDIAHVAERFGQEDDITVVTIACGA